MTKPTLASIESLFNESKDYAQNRLTLLKLKAADKSAGIASGVILGIALFVIFFIFFIVLNIGIALLIGDLVGKSYLGFLIWAGFYAIAGLVLFFGRNKIVKAPVTNMIIGKFFKNGTVTTKSYEQSGAA